LWEEENNRKISDRNVIRKPFLVHLIKVVFGHDKALRNEEIKVIMGFMSFQ
jgi:predicted nuclease of restriction endonuclease-like RecB superfamily